jgi:hypothetical protein
MRSVRERISSRVLAIAIGCLMATLFVVSNVSVGQPAKPDRSSSATGGKPAAGQKDRDLQTFMRKKLSASSQILEGLCTDDMKLVAEGARTLHSLSDAERWHVRNDLMYKQFSNEYRQITQDLIQAAEDNKPDRVSLKWVDATMSCLDCHRFVRGVRVAN